MKHASIANIFEWRYAVKKFDPERKISDFDWKTLESSLVMCPSGYGLQPWKFQVIRDPEVRRALTPASLGQSQIEDCSHFVVFTSRECIDESYIESYIERVAEVRGTTKESLAGYHRMMVDDLVHGPKSKFVREWAARQAYIALGSLLTVAGALTIDSCPLEGIEPERYDAILNLRGSGYRTLAGCALGYRSAEDKYAKIAKVRFEPGRVIQYI